eukprot:scaffold19442_cov112-Isochrysis_galbana.AAC.3
MKRRGDFGRRLRDMGGVGGVRPARPAARRAQPNRPRPDETQRAGWRRQPSQRGALPHQFALELAHNLARGRLAPPARLSCLLCLQAGGSEHPRAEGAVCLPRIAHTLNRHQRTPVLEDKPSRKVVGSLGGDVQRVPVASDEGGGTGVGRAAPKPGRKGYGQALRTSALCRAPPLGIGHPLPPGPHPACPRGRAPSHSSRPRRRAAAPPPVCAAGRLPRGGRAIPAGGLGRTTGGTERRGVRGRAARAGAECPAAGPQRCPHRPGQAPPCPGAAQGPVGAARRAERGGRFGEALDAARGAFGRDARGRVGLTGCGELGQVERGLAGGTGGVLGEEADGSVELNDGPAGGDEVSGQQPRALLRGEERGLRLLRPPRSRARLLVPGAAIGQICLGVLELALGHRGDGAGAFGQHGRLDGTRRGDLGGALGLFRRGALATQRGRHGISLALRGSGCLRDSHGLTNVSIHLLHLSTVIGCGAGSVLPHGTGVILGVGRGLLGQRARVRDSASHGGPLRLSHPARVSLGRASRVPLGRSGRGLLLCAPQKQLRAR